MNVFSKQFKIKHFSKETETIDQAVLGAAMIVMRDGTADLRQKERDWAERLFTDACAKNDDRVGARMRRGMLFNPLAISFAGRAFALKDIGLDRRSAERLLDMAAGDAAAARGAATAIDQLSTLDVRLPRALLRVAFAASYYTWHSYEATEAEKAAAKSEIEAKTKRQLHAELAWLFDGATEPGWPEFIDDGVRKYRRPRLKLGVAPARTPKRDRLKRIRHVDHQSAALWLESLWYPRNLDWAQDVYRTYAPWTLAANGAGAPDDEETADRPDEWNRTFFKVMANCLPAWSQDEIAKQLKPILDLGEDDFLDVTAQLIRDMDVVYFNAGRPAGETAAAVRKKLAERLTQCRQWRRLRGAKDAGVGIEFGPAVAAQFFGVRNFGQAPACYLSPGAIPRSDPFIAGLQELAVSAPSAYVAVLLLNWLEVSPRSPQLPLLLAFGLAAIEVYPDDRLFWIDHDIGRRVCAWLEKLRAIDAAPFAEGAAPRGEIDRLLARLVAIGVMEARRLELAISSVKGAKSGGTG